MHSKTNRIILLSNLTNYSLKSQFLRLHEHVWVATKSDFVPCDISLSCWCLEKERLMGHVLGPDSPVAKSCSKEEERAGT